MATGATLGTALASAFGVANSLPNMVTEVVLGSVLSALVVPVLVRAEAEDADGGVMFARRLLGVCLAILSVATVCAIVAAPVLVAINLGGGEVNTSAAVAFAYLLLPQILFYGLSSLLIAQLNTVGRFAAGGWAPVANNMLVLGVFAAYWTVPGRLDENAEISLTDPHVLLLGFGTTAGVAIQALMLIAAAKRAGLPLRPAWGLDPRLRSMGSMGCAIVLYVAIGQAGLVVSNLLGAHSDARAPWFYQQVWMLIQVPYGVLGVAVIAAMTPRIARSAATQDHDAVRSDLATSTSSTVLILMPIAVLMTVFSGDIAIGFFAYGQTSDADAFLLGRALAASAFTLIPYAIVLIQLRVFYAYQRPWTPTLIAVAITVSKVAFSLIAVLLITDPDLVVAGLTAANGASFLVGAGVGTLLLRRQLGHLGGRRLIVVGVWSLGVSAFAVLCAGVLHDIVLARWIPSSWGSLGVVAGVLIASAVALILGIFVACATPLRNDPFVRRLLASAPYSKGSVG
ncbi:MAG: hypothetical protein LLG14_06685 [Nocardiaceae bacterium]|nr:hypothetical protein [Nocardiaceae bacterium]